MQTESLTLRPAAIASFDGMVRRLLGLTLIAEVHAQDWVALIKPLADLEATARIARQVAERQAEVA